MSNEVCRPKLARAFVLGAGVVVGAWSTGASAAEPQVFSVVSSAVDPAVLLLRTTTHNFLSRDGGSSWGFLCQQAVGYRTDEIPSFGITQTGTLLAATFTGLSTSYDGACQWLPAEGPLGTMVMADVVVDPSEPSRAFAVVGAQRFPDPGFLNQVHLSSDDARSWNQLGDDFSVEPYLTEVAISPSDSDVVYLLSKGSEVTTLHRSGDRGRSWQENLVPFAGPRHNAYFSEIHPADPSSVLIRIQGRVPDAAIAPSVRADDSVLLTPDGGETWTVVFAADARVAGAVFVDDGVVVGVGDREVAIDVVVDPAAFGVWRATALTGTFERMSSTPLVCLERAPTGLYACATAGAASWDFAHSSNSGATFEPLFSFRDVAAPLPCAEGSTYETYCRGSWVTHCQERSSSQCDFDAARGDVSVVESADATRGPRGAPDDSVGEGGCATRSGTRQAGAWLLAVVLAAFAGAPSRRRSPAATGV